MKLDQNQARIFWHEGKVVYSSVPTGGEKKIVVVVTTCNTEDQAKAVANYYRLLARL